MSSLTRMCLVGLLAACGSKPATPVGPVGQGSAEVVAADAAVQEGGGWKRTAPGSWIYDPGFDQPSQVNLIAPPTGRGIERLELPVGATGATLVSVTAGLTKAGAFTWTAYAATGEGAETGAQVATGDGTSTTDGTVEWVETAMNGAGHLNGPFLVAFTTRSGEPAVGATKIEAPGNVYFQANPDEPAQLTPFAAFVKVTLTNVH